MNRKERNLLNAMWQECDGDYEHYVDMLINAKFTASEIRQEFEEQLPDGIERMENRLQNYYNEKFSTNYLYVLEWRYNTRYPENDFCMITKLPETEVDTEYQVQQTSSISGFMHQSYLTLEDALAEAIITPEECIYRNISAKEVETASKYLSERRKMKTAKEYVDSFLNLYEEKKAELSKEYEKEGRDLTSEEAVQDIKEEAYYYFSGDEYYESVTFSVWLETQLGLILLEEGYVSPCEYSAAKALKEYLADADEMPSTAEDAIIKALSELADKEKNDRVKLSKVTLKEVRCEMNDDKFTVIIPCKQEPDPITISAISRKEFEDKLEEAWLLYREKGYKVVFVDKSYGITWRARVELYENSIPLDMQQCKCQFVRTTEGWFRLSTAGVCNCCGMYKELNVLNEKGYICNSCSDPITF